MTYVVWGLVIISVLWVLVKLGFFKLILAILEAIVDIFD